MLMVEDVDLTPNPHALKFILNQKLLNYETRQYPDKESANETRQFKNENSTNKQNRFVSQHTS